jgi:hypothetical protein
MKEHDRNQRLIADSFIRTATWAAPTLSGTLPKAFDKVTRARRPPRLVRTIIRTV